MSDEILTRRCPRCKQSLPITDFGSGARIDYCKPCRAEKSREHNKTPRGRAVSAWRLMNRRIITQPEYAGIEVRMTRAEFLEWAEPRYAAWAIEHPGETPTVDRIKPNGHYELGNIRLLEWGENARLARRNRNVHAPAGMHWCGRCEGYLPLDRFGKSRNKIHGVADVCKACRIASTAHHVHPRWVNHAVGAGLRHCCTCRTVKPVADFYTCRIHGYQSACKACQNASRTRRRRGVPA